MAVKQNDIRIGSRDNPFLALDNSDIISINGNLACDLLCEEIPIDTLEIQCRYDRLNRIFAPSDYGGLQTADGMSFRSRETAGGVPEIPYATGLWYFNDDKYIGKFYVSDAKRTGKYVYTITAVSAMGVLDRMKHYGKMFLNIALMDALRDILLTDGLQDTQTPFLLDLYNSILLSDGVESVRVSGWIPVCTKREALHHVLFAQGLNIFKAENDAFLISRVSASSVGNIEPKNEYNSGTVDLTDRVKLIQVTEHSFIQNQNTESIVLFDNTQNPLDTQTIVFFDSAPIIVSTVVKTDTINIQKINENCAMISGIGTLTGKPYSHTSSVLYRENTGILDGETISVSDATLVNTLNSNAVADRVFAYYTQRRQMQTPIVLNGERCGMKYACASPYGDDVQAYITAMSISASAIAKADCRMIAGYVPPSVGSEFSHMELLTGSGCFHVPEEVLQSDNPRIRFVLIGGGRGGDAGANGKLGPYDVVEYENQLAQPGSPGKNGQPGKILSIQFDGDDVLSDYYYSCGGGGSGGTGGGKGSPGYSTSLYKDSLYYKNEIASSGDGTIIEAGYLDIISGNIYGGNAPDYSWVKSGRGGGFCTKGFPYTGSVPFAKYYPPEGGYYVVNKEIHDLTGYPIGSVQYAAGGAGGGSHDRAGADYNEHYMWPAYYDGAGGGGPITVVTTKSEKMNGTESKIYQPSWSESVLIHYGAGGRGADGVTPPSPMELSPTAYGQGGIGGMGGGGGGSMGVINTNLDWSGYTPDETYSGEPGYGGKGSDGAPGCILVYY